MKQHYATVPVSFARTTRGRWARRLDDLARSGWLVHREVVDQRVIFVRKAFDQPVEEAEVEAEIREIMGSDYENVAAPGSPKNLADSAPRVPSVIQAGILAELRAHGWVPVRTVARTRADIDPADIIVSEGGGTIAIRPSSDDSGGGN